MIPLKVGNKTFYASEITLKKSEYFNSLLSRWDSTDIILDEEPKLFRHFLNCLRHDTYIIPDKYKENVTGLLEYYGVKYIKVDQKQLEPIIWKAKSVLYNNDNKQIFKFNGKLADIKTYSDNFNLKISFNGSEILSNTSFFTRKYISTCNSYSLNKQFRNYVKNFEGEFSIEFQLVQFQRLEILYFEK